MSFEGMDVDQLQGLAKQVDADAQKLYQLVQSLNGVMGGLTFLWNGPVAATFEQNWQSKNRPALLAAYNALTSLHAHLVDNINQQNSASAAEGGWTASKAVGLGEDILKIAGSVVFPLGVIDELGGAAPALGKGESLLKKAWSFTTDDHALHLEQTDVKWIQKGAKIIDGTPALDQGLKVLGFAGSAVGVIHTVEDAYRAERDFNDGNYAGAASEFTEGVADGLQAYPSPVTYLAGVDVKLLDQVANLDWKDTPNPFSGSNFQQDYVPALKEEFTTTAGLKEAGKTLWSAM